MKKLLFTITIAVLASTLAVAQKPAPFPSSVPVSVTKEAPPQLTEQQQKRIADAVAQGERVRTEMRAAALRVESLQSDAVPFVTRLQATLELMEVKARDETAQTNIAASIYFVMAQLGASPDTYEMRPSESGFIIVQKASPLPAKN